MNFKERLQSYFPVRDIEIYLAVQGGRTGSPRTLADTAAEFGLSAERVRQVASNIEDSVRFLDLPEAAAFRALLGAHAPVRADDLKGEVEAILGCPGISAAGFFRVLSSVGQAGSFQLGALEQTDGSLLHLFAPAAALSIETVCGQVRRIARASGAVSAASVRTAFPCGPWDEIAIERLLPLLPGIQRLDGDPHWYWFSDLDNAPVRKVKAYLAEAGCLSCEECLAGDLIFGEAEICIRPPLPVFRALLAHYDIDADGNLFVARPGAAPPVAPVAKAKKTSNSKVRMIELLKAHGAPMRIREFFSACEQVGISPNTARIYMYRYNALFKIKDGRITLCAACAPP